ncbi:MAG TPA: galactokinase [Flavisolibacter sp.]|jgi:galactokinase|nr:galactokinase [Flavisolibacter sp.]
MNQQLSKLVKERFQQRFGTEPLLVRSPGRVNVIGEHTDYNNGFVLPAAIDKAIYIGVSRREDEEIVLYSEEFEQEHRSTVSGVAISDKQWPNYILGVVDQLNKRGHTISGFNLNIDGDVPVGAGLSSSAAVECATAFALNELFGLGIDKMELALIGQKAEHTFAGVMCGIMDQFASVFGKEGHVIRLDCQSLEYQYVPLQLEGYKILLLNTNVKHSLSSSEYNTRRQECAEGVRLLQAAGEPVESLRDANLIMVTKHLKDKNEVVYRRCKYIVEENQRLLMACEALEAGDLKTLGLNMYGSHEGLQHEYEVSCKELDFLVDAVRGNEAVLGARMTGGGFGGCTINIVREEAIDQLVTEVGKRYKEATGLDLTPYIAITANGSSLAE